MLAVLAVVACLWLSLAYHLRQTYDAALSQARRDVTNVSIALAEQVSRIVLSADQIMRLMQDDFAHDPQHFDFQKWMQRASSLDAITNQIAIFDEKGEFLASRVPPKAGAPHINIAQSPDFRTLAEHPEAGLLVGRTRAGRVTKGTVFPLFRRLSDAAGRFRGALAVSLDPEYLAQQFRSLDSGQDSSKALIGIDGFVRTRTPSVAGMYDQNLLAEKSRAGVFANLAHKPSGTYRLASSFDGIPRIFGYRAVDGLPLVMSSGKSEAEVFAPYAIEFTRTAYVGCAATTCILVLLLLMLRESRRRAAREQSLRETHAALTEAEASFRGMFETSLDALCVYRIASDGTIFLDQMNRAAAQSRGLDRSALGKPLDQLLPANILAEARHSIDRVVSTRQSLRLRSDRGIEGSDNEIVIVPLIQSQEGAPVDRVFVSIRDIRHFREAQDAVAQSEARFRLLAENTSELIVLGFDDGRRSYISPASLRLLGFTPEELATEMLERRWVHPDDVETLAAAELVSGGLDTSISCRVRRKDGTWIWIEAISRRIPSAGDGEPTIIATFRDATERHAQAEALRQAKDAADAARVAAEQATRAKSDFLATMSHEIRTPLNGILGFTELLREETNLPVESRRHVERIRNAGSALRTVVDDILSFSKLEAGEVEFESGVFSVPSLIENAASIVRAFAQSKQLDLIVSLDPNVPDFVVGDHDRLRQILINLLNNAIKFTPRGGVTVSVASSAGRDGAEKLRFSVADTGIGIARDKHSRLFQRFSQVDGSISREYGGTGLGLAICRSLVEAMGGTIGVASNIGDGSTFWFEVILPMPDVGSDSRATEVATAVVGAREGIQSHTETIMFDDLVSTIGPSASVDDGPVDAPKRGSQISAVTLPASVRPLDILLVEDVSLNQELICAILAARGHRVDVVGDGSEGIMAVEDKPYDLVLMDVQMPHIDGITATRLIRNLASPRRFVPIVGVTAAVLSEQTAAARAAGMDDILAKPISLPQLDKMLDSAVRYEIQPPPDPDAYDQSVSDHLAGAIGHAKVKAMQAMLATSLTARFNCELGPGTMVLLKAEAHASIAGSAMLGFARFGTLCRAFIAADESAAESAYAALRHELYNVVTTIERDPELMRAPFKLENVA